MELTVSTRALKYSLGQLACRAGMDSNEDVEGFLGKLGVDIYYGIPKQPKGGGRNIVVVPCRPETWNRLLSSPGGTLFWCSPETDLPKKFRPILHDPIPVLSWGAGYEGGHKPFAERKEDGSIIFYADIITSTLFMLSRWEETVTPCRDEYERFPATASLAYNQGFLDRPIIDEYALVLRAWLKALCPRWEPKQKPPSVKLSHDIDHARRFPNLHLALRNFAGDVLKRHNLRLAMDSLQVLLRPQRDPFLRSIYELANLSERHGLRSAFYFMGAGEGLFDPNYRPGDRAIKRCINDLKDRGHEVGFHAGYNTLNDAERFSRERGRLERVLGNGKIGGRQHYLRFQVPHTWRMWEQAGMSYDSTLSYADHEGFRCGTCYPFRPFDIEHDRELNITEIPLIVMDGTLRQYRGLTPEEGEERILTLANRCKQVGGTFTLLWHNTSLFGNWSPWAAMYRRLMPFLSEMRG